MPFAASARHARCHRLPAVVATALLATGTAQAGDVLAGRAKVLKCQACHGVDGISVMPEAPSLAAQPESYLVAQLKAFKSGQRKAETMSFIAPTLSEQDIDDLAAYYAAVEVRVVRLPGG